MTGKSLASVLLVLAVAFWHPGLVCCTHHLSLCGKIRPSRVGNIHWSGNVDATSETVYYSGTPYVPGQGHVSVAPDDYFTLSKTSGTNYQLKQHGSNGGVKTEFAEGEVKANSDVVFYIIDGWFGTVITKGSHANRRATFSGLELNPPELLVGEACAAQQVHDLPTKTKSSIEFDANTNSRVEVKIQEDIQQRQWMLAAIDQDCDAACEGAGGSCDLAALQGVNTSQEVEAIAQWAGLNCNDTKPWTYHFTPSIQSNGICTYGAGPAWAMFDGTRKCGSNDATVKGAYGTHGNRRLCPCQIPMTEKPATATAAFGLCGRIDPIRLRDVQWSGNLNATSEAVYYTGTPYVPGQGHASVAPDDYFILSKTNGTQYQLRQHGIDGSVKTEFAEGEVKANSDVVFYIVDGWFGTVITKGNPANGSATFSNLELDPPELLCGSAKSGNPDRVRGVLHVTMSPENPVNASLEMYTDSATKIFLRETIADIYGFISVSILSIDFSRRLRPVAPAPAAAPPGPAAAGMTKLQVNFEGVGVVTPVVTSAGLSSSLKEHFEPYGWRIESASIELEGSPDTGTDCCQLGGDLLLKILLAVVFGALCSTIICVIGYTRWCRTQDRTPANTIVVVPAAKVKVVESSPCIMDIEPGIKNTDNETSSEPSNEVSTEAPSSEDLNALYI